MHDSTSPKAAHHARVFMVAVSAILALFLPTSSCIVQTESLPASTGCEPDSMLACYSGPNGTLGVGACRAGVRHCTADGSYSQQCEGEVVPSPENCATLEDDDCDGVPNQPSAGCGCIPGDLAACYSGPNGTEGAGDCQAGIHLCSTDGSGFGECIGEVVPTVQQCYSQLDENCDGQVGCDGSYLWGKFFGGAGDQFPGKTVLDRDGNLLFAATFFGNLDLGGECPPLTSAGGSDALVAKLDSNGNCIWRKQFGDSLDQQGVFLSIDNIGNILLGVRFEGTVDLGGGPHQSVGGKDAAVAKFDASGTHLWDRAFGAEEDEGIDGVLPDEAGNIHIVGYSSSNSVAWGGAPLVSKGDHDVIVSTFDADGNHLSSKRLGGPGYDRAFGATLDPNGALIIAGVYRTGIDFGGGPLQDNGHGQLFAAKYDSAGKHVWSKGFNSTGDGETFGGGLTLDTTGAVIVAGISSSMALDVDGQVLSGSGGQDAVLIKLDSSGTYLWGRRFGDGDDQLGIAVATDSAQNVIFAGRFRGTMAVGGETLQSSGDLDAFVMKFDAAGSPLWSRLFGGGAEQAANYLLTTPGGEILWSGWFAGSADSGNGVVTSAGGFDMFLLKLAP